ncbi:hypothetical protein FOQG_06037 [Fusarium oxysporum f. sp. raphani 54005]|jgi:hypothetical protein|uniref:Uncharacterized protein n=2 Tax=Fusarium oxysporum TaxID=5507 RepID=X0DC08_FUSOX|nr:hypothetical protein FOVG_06797 [Fusarium oxysporum f. sp. pisi HDV247]EXK92087.1 hypothetical protein FOQG_06037 [Fusarium oxysporum f. sp. raphani 54005]EXL57868.1 hypothetical protein FOCG_04891 [Fusarium oxysporum f. sp. radicis-lycopersici 26381]
MRLVRRGNFCENWPLLNEFFCGTIEYQDATTNHDSIARVILRERRNRAGHQLDRDSATGLMHGVDMSQLLCCNHDMLLSIDLDRISPTGQTYLFNFNSHRTRGSRILSTVASSPINVPLALL